MTSSTGPVESEPPIYPEGLTPDHPYMRLGESGDVIGAYHHGLPVLLELRPNKKAFCKKNGAHRLYKTLEKEALVIQRADAFMENTNKITSALGLGLACLGAPSIGLGVAALGLLSETANEIVVRHAHKQLTHARNNVALCESEGISEADKIKAARELIHFSRSVHFWEGGSKAIKTVGLYVIGEIYAIIDFSNTMKEASETYKDQPKQEHHLAQNFNGALHEFLHGLDLPREKLKDGPGFFKTMWNHLKPTS